MGADEQQRPRSYRRVNLHGGNDHSHEEEQPGPPAEVGGGGAGDDETRTALEALHAAVAQQLVQRGLQQVHEVLVSVEGVLRLHVLRVVEAEVAATARGRAGPDDASGKIRRLQQLRQLHRQDERTQHQAAEIGAESEVCRAAAANGGEIGTVGAGAAGRAEVGEAEVEEGVCEDAPVEVVDFDRAVVQVENVQPGVLLDELARGVEDIHGVRHVDCYDCHARVGADVLQLGLDAR